MFKRQEKGNIFPSAFPFSWNIFVSEDEESKNCPEINHLYRFLRFTAQS